jgi:hypothetical protein
MKKPQEIDKYKVVDYKNMRDEPLEAMVLFIKLGDKEMADAYLKLAANIHSISTKIESRQSLKDINL